MEDTDARESQPVEGRLFEQARERLGISQNEAGRRAKITGTRWRKIVYEVASDMTSLRGVKTLARMAQAVGVTPRQLADAGRADVADELLEMIGPLADDEAPALTQEEEAMLERIRRDPRKRRRLLDAILAGHGHVPPPTGADSDEQRGQTG